MPRAEQGTPPSRPATVSVPALPSPLDQPARLLSGTPVGMKRIVVPAFVLLLMATACYPPLPPERNRFLGIRMTDHHRRPVVMFGRCGSEVVTQVQLRYADPPIEVPHGGVLWRIASSGSWRSRFVVGETPSGFREVIPLGDSKLPSQYLSIEVLTDDARWPNTEFSFHPDQIPSHAFASYHGPTAPGEVHAIARSACVPRRPAYH
jgi:hypothetical protein